MCHQEAERVLKYAFMDIKWLFFSLWLTYKVANNLSSSHHINQGCLCVAHFESVRAQEKLIQHPNGQDGVKRRFPRPVVACHMPMSRAETPAPFLKFIHSGAHSVLTQGSTQQRKQSLHSLQRTISLIHLCLYQQIQKCRLKRYGESLQLRWICERLWERWENFPRLLLFFEKQNKKSKSNQTENPKTLKAGILHSLWNSIFQQPTANQTPIMALMANASKKDKSCFKTSYFKPKHWLEGPSAEVPWRKNWCAESSNLMGLS